MSQDPYPSPYAPELAAALELAREAGLRALGAQTGPLDIAHKADRSLVTAIDRELDAFLVGRLGARFPGDGVLGEESAEAGAARPLTRRLWLVDPIDGTSNYAVGAGEFTVVIGLAEAGRAVVGAVYEPIGSRLFYAASGGPALMRRDNEPPVPMRVSGREALAGARLVRSLRRRPTAIERYLEGLGVPAPTRIGSLALRICLIAAGEQDFTYTTVFRGGDWDLCAPLAVLEAAGGRASDLEGRPIRVGESPEAPLDGFVVSNGRLHGSVLAALAVRPDADRSP